MLNVGTKVTRDIDSETITLVVSNSAQKHGNKNQHLSAHRFKGTVQQNGTIVGLAKMFNDFPLKKGKGYKVRLTGRRYKMLKIAYSSNGPEKSGIGGRTGKSVLEIKQAKVKYIPPFALEDGSWKSWTPQNEKDLYVVFGALQEKGLNYRFVSSFTSDLKSELGLAKLEHKKCDAILLDTSDNRYLMAEFKILATDYKKNRKENKKNIDVLVVWEDDCESREGLPQTVLVLSDRCAKLSLVDARKDKDAA